MILTYEAVDAAGKRQRDTIDAPGTRQAIEQLRTRGLFVTNIAPEQEARKQVVAVPRRKGPARLNLKSLALFTRQLAMLLRSGSAVVPALGAIRRNMKDAGHAALVDGLIADLEDGNTLTDALRKHPDSFNSVYCAVVAAGEASGNMSQMFERLAKMVAHKLALRKRVVAALAYPCLLIVMSMSILNTLLFFVLPRFAGMFHDLAVEVPFTTSVMLATSRWLQDNWPIPVTAIILLGGLGVYMAMSAPGRKWFCDIQTRVPVLRGTMTRLIEAQVLRTMGTLLDSRVGVLDAIELGRGVTSNADFQRLFKMLEDSVTSGGQLSNAFEHTGLVQPYVCQAIRTGEDSGNLGGALTYCADMLDESNEELVNTAVRLIEPVVLIGMGLVVGGVAVSLFLPLFDMTAALN